MFADYETLIMHSNCWLSKCGDCIVLLHSKKLPVLLAFNQRGDKVCARRTLERQLLDQDGFPGSKFISYDVVYVMLFYVSIL